MIDPIVLLVNPAAGGGQGRKLLNRAYAALRTVGPVEVLESERAGDESRLASLAARSRTRARPSRMPWRRVVSSVGRPAGTYR